MSFNGSGTFVVNSTGQPVVTGTVISSTAFNALTADLATGLSTCITKDGQTATTVRVPFAFGISSTLTTDSTSATTGSIVTAGGISTQKALWVGTTSRLVGAVTADTLTASKPVFTDASKGLVSTGTLAYDQGGTGQTTYAAGDIIYASATNTLAKRAIGTSSQVLTVTAGMPTWATLTTGTVTSVAQSFTGGLISVAGSPITTSGTLALTVAGTSGGVPYFSTASTWATSAALAANAIVIGGGAGAAPATTTTGTGAVTALGVAVGTAGAFVVNGGALGTPSSGNLTNCTGMSGLQSTQITGTWTVPSNVISSTRVKFRLVGGGGGGGGAATTTNATGAGGASGDYIEAVFSGFTAGQTVTASIGAAGAAGSSSGGAGGDGGDTTLTYNSVTICLASKGGGGTGATTTAMTAPGLVYGTSNASVGASGLTLESSTVVATRGAGTAGSYPVFANAGTVYISGTGGSNPMGNGGRGIVNGSPGIDATGYGGGGSGGSRASATDRAGGAGAAGCVFVEYVR